MEKKVKKALHWNAMIIKLYEVEKTNGFTSSVNNIETFDLNGSLLWTAEPPNSPMDFYWDMKIDTISNIVLAYTAKSFLAKIDLNTGKTLEFHMSK